MMRRDLGCPGWTLRGVMASPMCSRLAGAVAAGLIVPHIAGLF